MSAGTLPGNPVASVMRGAWSTLERRLERVPGGPARTSAFIGVPQFFLQI